MNATDALLPRDENVAAMVEPTDEEVDAAITGNMGHLVTVVSLLLRPHRLLQDQKTALRLGTPTLVNIRIP